MTKGFAKTFGGYFHYSIEYMRFGSIWKFEVDRFNKLISHDALVYERDFHATTLNRQERFETNTL